MCVAGSSICKWWLKIKGTNDSSRDSGSVVVEFALTFPVLLIFLYGIVEVSQVTQHLAWIGRVAYESALAGAKTSGDGFRATKAQGVAADTFKLINATDRQSMPFTAALPVVATVKNAWQQSAAAPWRDNLSVQLRGNSRFSTGHFVVGFSETYVAPVLVLENSMGDNYTGTANASVAYDCCLKPVTVPVSGCPTTPPPYPCQPF